MAERLNALVLKTSKGATPSRVRIPVSPPIFINVKKSDLTTIQPMFLETLGFVSHSYDEEITEVSMEFNVSKLLTHSNGTIVQGGFITAMMDSSMGHVVVRKLNGEFNLATLSMNINFILPGKPGNFIAKGYIDKIGKSIAFTSSKLFQDNKLVATASASNKLIRIKKMRNKDFLNQIKPEFDFDISTTPKAPDYHLLESWVAHPNKYGNQFLIPNGKLEQKNLILMYFIFIQLVFLVKNGIVIQILNYRHMKNLNHILHLRSVHSMMHVIFMHLNIDKQLIIHFMI